MPLKPFGFPREERLVSRRDFQAAYSGKRAYGRFFIVYYRRGEDFPGRKAAFTVSKKVFSSAVDRNKLKRRLREIYRCGKYLLPEDIRLVVRSLPRASSAEFYEIKREMAELFSLAASGQSGHRVRQNL